MLLARSGDELSHDDGCRSPRGSSDRALSSAQSATAVGGGARRVLTSKRADPRRLLLGKRSSGVAGPDDRGV